MKHYKSIVISFFAIIILGTPWILTRYPSAANFVDNIFAYVSRNYTAGFFREGITIAQIKNKYEVSERNKRQNVRIMIVPGHEPGYGGAEYRDILERDLSVELGEELKSFFENDPHYEVIISRDKKYWNPVLQTYFNQNWNDIKKFYDTSKEEMLRLVNNGTVTKFQNGIFHNEAAPDVAMRLYGINKWNNENGIDLVIHIHLNDYPRPYTKTAGKYSGFAIYVPERQYSNSTTTSAIAESVMERFKKYNPVSDMPREKEGLIEERELIAIGSYNTLDVPSMLIEYGYIYEPQFNEDDIKAVVLKDLAYQTFLGVEDFFGEKNNEDNNYDTLVLPFTWKNKITSKNSLVKDVLALQTALVLDGEYPPSGKSLNDCPRTGTFGPCTITALNAFQTKHGIKNENGFVGDETRRVLNNLYSVEPK